MALGLTREELETCFVRSGSRMTREDLVGCLDPKSAGAVRISLGLASNFADAYAFVEFARSFVGA